MCMMKGELNCLHSGGGLQKGSPCCVWPMLHRPWCLWPAAHVAPCHPEVGQPYSSSNRNTFRNIFCPILIQRVRLDNYNRFIIYEFLNQTHWPRFSWLSCTFLSLASQVQCRTLDQPEGCSTLCLLLTSPDSQQSSQDTEKFRRE